MEQSQIRNFCIIAHVDHGKSTLADRFLEITNSVPSRSMMNQYLDQMDLERERGITIKAQAVRLNYDSVDKKPYQLNIIDTPGHVDFSNEVFRSLRACDGALLLVDASQGIQAQTLANFYSALEADLTIIPVINKIDLPSARVDEVSEEIQQTFGFKSNEIQLVSAKTGEGVKELLDAVVELIPPPSGDKNKPLRALVFDSTFDSYKGAIIYVRIVDGELQKSDSTRFLSTNKQADTLDIGFFQPTMTQASGLTTGEVGYVATGLKSIRDVTVGDTLSFVDSQVDPIPGYQELKSMVYAGLYPSDGESYQQLRDALEKLQLNDAAFSFQPESSVALGFGFRCGFLGLLHMDVVQERLEREYDLDLIITSPSVLYKVLKNDGIELEIQNPSQLPPQGDIMELKEPWLEVTVVTPTHYIGPIMELITSRRGELRNIEYIQSVSSKTDDDKSRALLSFYVPLSEVILDLHDQIKSKSQGYASLDYNQTQYRTASLSKLEILVNYEPVDALSSIVHRDRATYQGRNVVKQLTELIPRQLFPIPIQASVNGRVIARETVRALRKNVLAKCYGGDITRKRKLLQKQAEGKKRMKMIGHVEVPQEAFIAILKNDN
jgi:GTP-binding protein LepA